MSEDLLTVSNLVTTFATDGGRVKAIDDVSFSIRPGETIGLVGESGSGKSVTSLSIMRLIQAPAGRISSGKIMLQGRDILTMTEAQMRTLRGNAMGMIFQEPMTSLNPVFTIGNQIAEVFQIHQRLSKKEALERAIDMLKLVKIPAPEKRIKEYPHQLSGGMRQRVMIAMALACKPKLLIADEPTTALDVTIQAQILDLMRSLQKEIGMAILLITHDLGVVAEVCDNVMVMYAGRVVERGPVKEIFQSPRHPYTQGLLKSIPVLGKRIDVLPTIKGTVPSLSDLGEGCHFRGRCAQALPRCATDLPLPKTHNSTTNHSFSCWNAVQA
jgi:oligopeptide/dipeptide ABC transporter ATP-binding protein